MATSTRPMLHVPKNMRDGVYQVSLRNVSAGFTIKDGKVEDLAPILRKSWDYWVCFAVRIGD